MLASAEDGTYWLGLISKVLTVSFGSRRKSHELGLMLVRTLMMAFVGHKSLLWQCQILLHVEVDIEGCSTVGNELNFFDGSD